MPYYLMRVVNADEAVSMITDRGGGYVQDPSDRGLILTNLPPETLIGVGLLAAEDLTPADAADRIEDGDLWGGAWSGGGF